MAWARMLLWSVGLSWGDLPLSGSPAEALKQYQAGKYDAAFKEYDRLRLQRPEDARLAFNAGAAAYQARQFEDATRHFSGATGARDPKLAQSAFYNLGNAYFQMGDAASDAAQKQQAWESSLGFYDTALKLNAADSDAKHNRDFVHRKLEELKQQQQQQDKQQSKDNQDQKQDDKKDEQKNDQKRDKSGQDKKQEEKKSDDQKQPQKPDGSKQDDNKKPEQPPKPDQPEDQKQPDQKKGQEQKSQPPGQQKQGEKGEQGDKDSAQAAALGQMTSHQAMQLLDSQRAEERALIFLPTNTTQKASNRTLKNW